MLFAQLDKGQEAAERVRGRGGVAVALNKSTCHCLCICVIYVHTCALCCIAYTTRGTHINFTHISFRAFLGQLSVLSSAWHASKRH